jgi:hypothetical protein
VTVQELAVGGFDMYYDRMAYLTDGFGVVVASGSELLYGSTNQAVHIDAAEPRQAFGNLESTPVYISSGPRRSWSTSSPPRVGWRTI